MTEYEFDTQVNRIEAAFGKDYTEGFKAELKAVYISYSLDRFRLAVSHVIQHNRYLPRIAQFHEAMEYTAKPYASEFKAETSCERCDHGWIRVYVRQHGTCYESNVPCPKCKPGIKLKTPQNASPLEEITREEYLQWRRARHATA